ncbi:YdeI/OmpD-associated family protein [Dyella sp. 20L07]|uniref:YdeI/OmpD-associated family protein n=1 Tax=Dyella sp. 20L07 TaxID=3384240 RepID=UPI003D2E6747
MATHDSRIDAYIANAAPFAQPILAHLRALVHATCPEVEESVKWRMPFFSYKGALMCSMAAFKQHCSFGFWLYKQVTDNDADDGMGQLGKLTSLKDLPPKRELVALIRKAMSLNDAGVTMKRPKSPAPKTPDLPDELATLLAQKKHAAARKHYESFPPGAKREYIAWITEAKTDATRQKRIATTLAWLAEGKRRNWKYESC